MNIIEKDISWLVEKVPDFNEFYNNNKEIFSNGGYVAGGFLRKIVTSGSANSTLNSLNMNSSGDIDWFFYNQSNCQTAWQDFCKLHNQSYCNIKDPNSITKFAFESYKNGIKYQFIYKSFGIPSTVLNRFDIANCKIATNGKKVWMVEDWEMLQQNKFIRVDNFAGDYLIFRLKKYITGEFSVLPSQKQEVLVKMLESTTKHQSAIKYLVTNTDTVCIDDILLFYKKLGEYNEIVTLEAYNQGTLGKTEDFALHMYNKKKIS